MSEKMEARLNFAVVREASCMAEALHVHRQQLFCIAISYLQYIEL